MSRLSFGNGREQQTEERLLGTEPAEVNAVPLHRKVWDESKKMWRVSFPAILARMSSLGVFIVTQAFVGHISSIDLASYALIQSFAIRFANGVLLGMSSATETLCGQAFGAKQYHMLGIYLQRSWIINLATATILVPPFVFAGKIFVLIGQELAIAEEAGVIALWFIPILYYFVFSFTVQKYLQCQQRNRIIAWLSVGSFAVHVFLSWLFVYVLNWGIPGAMGAILISSWLVVIGEFVFILGGWCSNTWKGFTFAAFLDLWPITKLSVSSGVMMCLELWYNALLVLMAGYMKDASVAIAAFSICINVATMELMIPVGFLSGTSVRVSNELGQGDAKAAKFAVKVVLATSLSIGVFIWAMCLIFGHDIGYIFTTDEDVIESISSLSVLLAFTILLNSVQPVLSGVAVGCGRQAMVAWVNLASYYLVGIPLGMVLAYVAHLEVRGIWIGMISGVVLQTLVLGFVIWRTDWDEQVKRASERLNRWFLHETEDRLENTSGNGIRPRAEE